jgi:hypothetical protein
LTRDLSFAVRNRKLSKKYLPCGILVRQQNICLFQIDM